MQEWQNYGPANLADYPSGIMTIIEGYYDENNFVIVNFGTFNTANMVFNTEKYTEAELDAMTKRDILDLGFALGYEMTTTASNTKEEIIAEFLQLQG